MRLPGQVVLSIVGLFLMSLLLSGVLDEKKSEEIAALHRSHVLLFGHVRTGLGMHTVHLKPDDPRRVAVINMFKALKVRAAANGPLHSCSSSRRGGGGGHPRVQ